MLHISLLVMNRFSKSEFSTFISLHDVVLASKGSKDIQNLVILLKNESPLYMQLHFYSNKCRVLLIAFCFYLKLLRIRDN